jgi:2-iminoacetate synthase
MTFLDIFNPKDLFQKSISSLSVSQKEVEKTLQKEKWTSSDLPVLLSPAAANYLEEMAQLSHKITVQRFGYTMQLFIPLYISNECNNTCTYCGFSQEYDYPRKTLSFDEVKTEAGLLKEKGFDHLLILTGEAPKTVDASYIAKSIEGINTDFSSIGIEIQPLDEVDYKKLIDVGVDSLSLYQETYHRESYSKYHLYGKKRLFDHRLNAVDEGGKAGFHRINLGVLLGLYDFRFEALALSAHLDYMQKTYWKSKLGISFPRIKEMFGDFSVDYPVDDPTFVQLICAFRLVYPDLTITLSTREEKELRNNLIPLGITSMSAESDTSPGGYSHQDAEKQFEISDDRTLSEIQTLLKSKGYDPIIKDWDNAYLYSKKVSS